VSDWFFFAAVQFFFLELRCVGRPWNRSIQTTPATGFVASFRLAACVIKPLYRLLMQNDRVDESYRVSREEVLATDVAIQHSPATG
jgi:hypothetical protein